MLVKASMRKNRNPAVPMMAVNLTDFDNTVYARKPANMQKMAVRVPVGNMAHALAMPMAKNRYLYFLILLVIPKMIKATAADAR